jgi:hypothetical protein
MGRQTKIVACRTVLTLGFAALATAALLYLISVHAPEISALTEGTGESTPNYDDVGVTWTSTTPVTTTVGSAGKVWVITTHNMTITFYLNSVVGTAVFTFTPQSDTVIDGLVAGSHFFRLEGRYTDQNGGSVSLGEDIKIRLQYTPADLGGAREDTLRLYYYDPLGDEWLVQDKEVSLDPWSNILECKTNETGLFGLGGYEQQTRLPVVLRSHHQ